MGGRLRLDGQGSRECPNFRLETRSTTATLRILPSIVLETLAVAIAHKVVNGFLREFRRHHCQDLVIHLEARTYNKPIRFSPTVLARKVDNLRIARSG